MADITMPQLGETVTEGTITRWAKHVGDRVELDEVLFEVSTDKVDSEVPSSAAGFVSEILVPEAGRVLASKGAQVILNPTSQRGPGATTGYVFVGGEPPCDAVRQSLAYTTGTYVLSASPARESVDGGDGEEEWWGGASAVVGPDGHVLARVEGLCEGVALARIDLAKQAEVRAKQERDTTPAAVLYRGLYP